MSPKKDKKADKALSEAEIFSLAREHEDAKAKEKKFKGIKDRIKGVLVSELERRNLKTLTQLDTGLTVTKVQAESVIYDPEGIRKDPKIKASIKSRIFKRNFSFTVLPRDRQKELLDMIRKSLTQAELTACTSYELDEEEMSRMVQSGDLSAKLIAPHSEIKKNAAFVTVTMGTGN